MEGFEGILVTISSTQGSTPRDQGAWIWVSMDNIKGSIGGGILEDKAISLARKLLLSDQQKFKEKITLGPMIGQCCGGVVELSFQKAPCPEPSNKQLHIFGAGHIGSQIYHLCKTLPFEAQLYDERAQINIENPAPYSHHERLEPIIASLPKDSLVLIMTHDHGLDFRLCEMALLNTELAYVGMIGSKSKATKFRKDFAALGSNLEKLHAPIAKDHTDKRPMSIALRILLDLVVYS